MPRVKIFYPKALWETCKWFVGNAFFSLFPFIIIFFLNAFSIDETTDGLTKKEVNHLLNDGVLVFFACALMGSIAVDVWISKEHKKLSRKYRNLRKIIPIALLKVPFWTIVSLGMVYLSIVYGAEPEDYFHKLGWYPRVVIGICFVYCFTYKYITFINEGGKHHG